MKYKNFICYGKKLVPRVPNVKIEKSIFHVEKSVFRFSVVKYKELSISYRKTNEI